MIYNTLKKEIESFGFNVVFHYYEMLCEEFLVIDERQSQEFYHKFFEGLDFNILKIRGKLAEPVKKNGYVQYHLNWIK